MGFEVWSSGFGVWGLEFGVMVYLAAAAKAQPVSNAFLATRLRGYRGTSLTRYQLPLGPYSKTMPRALR